MISLFIAARIRFCPKAMVSRFHVNFPLLFLLFSDPFPPPSHCLPASVVANFLVSACLLASRPAHHYTASLAALWPRRTRAPSQACQLSGPPIPNRLSNRMPDNMSDTFLKNICQIECQNLLFKYLPCRHVCRK